MSGGEVRVIRREAGQESPRMPAWKREILERRKAKGGGAGAGAAEPSSSASATRLNGEVTGESSASKNKESVPSASSGRNYTITPASQHFAGKRGSASASPELSPVKSNKDPWITNDILDAEKTGRGRGGEESLVLQDSLGPLQENPFIKLEKERKRRQDRESATRPVQHILELYGSVPGIRTIRAENIIIIESDPGYFPDGGGIKSGAKLQQNGTVSSYSSLSDLVDRRGSGVTEIRAKEVVIYDSALSRSEENLSTLGRPGSDGALDLGQGQGRVSRMLQKFDRNYGRLQPKSRSTENLLELETGPLRPRLRPKPQPDQVPKSATPPLHRSPAHSPDRVEPGSVFQSALSSTPLSDASLEGQERGASPAGSPQSVSSYRRHFEKSGGRSVRVDPREGAERFQARPLRLRDWRGPEDSSCPRVPSSPERHWAGAVSPSGSSSPPSPGFEIRPSPRPDLSALPAGDLQARAGQPAPAVPQLLHRHPPPPLSHQPRPVPDPARHSHTPSEPDTPPAPVSSSLPSEPHPPTPSVGSLPEAAPPAGDHLPITNIDDIELEPRPPGPSPMVQRRSGNTFTVAPYAQLGSLLKKRYPAVDEIEVIGGYLSLGRSCLSRVGSSGKKLNISFNESALSSTFEYPSESSLWDSEDEERDGEEEEDTRRGEEERTVGGRMLIPRASYTPTNSTPNAGTNSSDLSSYTPKNSVDFSAWQEHKLDDPSFPGDSNAQGTGGSSEEVMLTPADSSSRSDFSSEPALYF
ncbi:hypothetical protein COCON_G00163370 [Conger conger]|uniref:Taperin n=1 Tax=Conger conger TaxID=82655 RepID=A0A9Q1HT01_CONCO|nr:hypothetical protein COCON_G00163370 [Conger conger]